MPDRHRTGYSQQQLSSPNLIIGLREIHVLKTSSTDDTRNSGHYCPRMSAERQIFSCNLAITPQATTPSEIAPQIALDPDAP